MITFTLTITTDPETGQLTSTPDIARNNQTKEENALSKKLFVVIAALIKDHALLSEPTYEEMMMAALSVDVSVVEEALPKPVIQWGKDDVGRRTYIVNGTTRPPRLLTDRAGQPITFADPPEANHYIASMPDGESAYAVECDTPEDLQALMRKECQ